MADETPVNPVTKLLQDIDQGMPWDKAMSLVQVSGAVDNNNMMKRNALRMEAQVDALIRAKEKQCGMEGNYQPPKEDDDEMATYINCPIIGAEALAAINKGAPQQQPQIPPQEKPWWQRLVPWILILGSVLLGSLIVFITANFFQGDPTAYEAIAIPFDPNR